MTARLYEQYRHRIYGFVRKRVRTRELAEDIVQDVFVAYWTQSPEVDDPLRYLCGIAKQLIANRARRQHTVGTLIDDPLIEPSPLRTEIVDLMEILTSRERSAIWLGYIEGCNSTEVGCKLGITATAARKLTERALKKLRHLTCCVD
jgi:RNA polymerase sigma-70 factor (ECF subfamily)